jgi:hypothetical protein
LHADSQTLRIKTRRLILKLQHIAWLPKLRVDQGAMMI